jgi:hypothetical protein
VRSGRFRNAVRRVRVLGRRIIVPRRLSSGLQQAVMGKWNYRQADQFAYGDETTYRKAMAYLNGHGEIEDWGCGTGFARRFATRSAYTGIDGSESRFTDKVADLRVYTSDVDCILIRHVLEHNHDWRTILLNAVGSFRVRMALVIFTPLQDRTRQIATWPSGIPDIGFRKDDLIEVFKHLRYAEESLRTATQYKTEHIFYIEKPASTVNAGSAGAGDT